jgi:hypothetical protein
VSSDGSKGLERVAEESEIPVSKVVRMILEAEMERSEGVGGGWRKKQQGRALRQAS